MKQQLQSIRDMVWGGSPFAGVFRIPSGAYDQMLESLT